MHDLKTITKNFSEDQIIGSGGYGIVYKGVQQNGDLVAVKKLIMTRASMDDKQFLNEVIHVIDICHPNIVRLEGYCYHTEKEVTFHEERHIFVDEVYRFLCFEYLPNGNLEKYLKDESSGLDWHMRYSIIHGICKGLYCLHEGRKGAAILHLDLKPSNILLDKNMTPKIADFGLSRLFGEGKTHIRTTEQTGTRGYMAPEYIDNFILSKESDIFSLGVIIVEIVTGHRKYPEGTSNQEFTEVKGKWKRRLQKSSNKTSLEEECRQVDQCIDVGLKCMEKDPKRRQTIREIVAILKRTECSVRKDGSYGEEWRERLDIIVSGSAKQSIEALKYIFLDLSRMGDTLWFLPEYITEDADRLVSVLTLMVRKSFSSYTRKTSPVHCKCTLNTLLQVFQIRSLARAVKKGTLEDLATEMLIWLSAQEIGKWADGSELLKDLNVAMLKIVCNADRTSLFVILINLLLSVDPPRWPSSTPLKLISVKNKRFSKLVVEYLHMLNEELESTINDLDLDLILQSIQAYFAALGPDELYTWLYMSDDKPTHQEVSTLLEKLVILVGSKIKDHLSLVPPFDADSEQLNIRVVIDEGLEEQTLHDEGLEEQSSHGDHDASSSTSATILISTLTVGVKCASWLVRHFS